MQVPQQADKENCGYRMLYNINKIRSKQSIEIIANEEMALHSGRLHTRDSHDAERETTKRK